MNDDEPRQRMRSYWYEVAGGWDFAYEENGEFPKGRIADYAVWSEPLTAQQIKALAAGARPTEINRQMLREWYPLDGKKD